MSELILECVEFNDDGITMFSAEYKGEKTYKLEYAGAWTENVEELAEELAFGVADEITSKFAARILPYITHALNELAGKGASEVASNDPPKRPQWPSQEQLDEINRVLDEAKMCCGNPDCTSCKATA